MRHDSNDSQPTSSFRALLVRLFGIDPRGLAVLRIALAFVLLIDLGLRALDFSALYTDSGLLPFRVSATSHAIPLHTISGAFWYQAFLFIVAAIFALLMLLGRFTRTATIASWAMLLSLHTQNFITCYFSDEILRAILFWCMFVPLGRVWSLDARRGHTLDPAASRRTVLSIGTAGLLLQIASVYFFTGALKSGSDWHETGLAIALALQRDWSVKPFGVFLANDLGGTLKTTTFLVLGFEIIAPLLLFSPVATRGLRMVIVVLSWFFQLMLGLSLYLELMPWVTSFVMLPFLPAVCWDGLEKLSPRLRADVRSDAAASPPPMAEEGSSLRAAKLRRFPRVFAELIAGGFLVYVLAYNVFGLLDEKGFPKALASAGNWLRINQKWAMFSPNVPREDGWYVIPGVLKDGRVVNLWWTGPELSWEKPKLISAYHRSHRWNAYEMRLTESLYESPQFSHFRRRYAEWHCHRWNATHSGDDELVSLDVWFIDERTRDDLTPPGQIPRRLYSLQCSDGYY